MVRELADMEVDKVADMVVDHVADMVTNMKVDMNISVHSATKKTLPCVGLVWSFYFLCGNSQPV